VQKGGREKVRENRLGEIQTNAFAQSNYGEEEMTIKGIERDRGRTRERERERDRGRTRKRERERVLEHTCMFIKSLPGPHARNYAKSSGKCNTISPLNCQQVLGSNSSVTIHSFARRIICFAMHASFKARKHFCVYFKAVLPHAFFLSVFLSCSRAVCAQKERRFLE
jgi:hypothetical protein